MKGRVSSRLREAINNGSLDAPTPVEPQTLPAEIRRLIDDLIEAAMVEGRLRDAPERIPGSLDGAIDRRRYIADVLRSRISEYTLTPEEIGMLGVHHRDLCPARFDSLATCDCGALRLFQKLEALRRLASSQSNKKSASDE